MLAPPTSFPISQPPLLFTQELIFQLLEPHWALTVRVKRCAHSQQAKTVNGGHWVDLWGRALPTSFSLPLWYPHFLFLITINSWPRAGGPLSILLPLPPLSASANTPVGRSRQSEVSQPQAQVCRDSQAPAAITSPWHQVPPLPSSTELPPQEIPPSPQGKAGYREDRARINQPRRATLLLTAPSPLTSGSSWSFPPPPPPPQLPLPVGQKKGSPSPLRCHPCAHCTVLFRCHCLTVESEKWEEERGCGIQALGPRKALGYMTA